MAERDFTPIGSRFSYLVVLGEAYKSEKNKRWYVPCRCDCGMQKNVMCKNLLGGNTVSCGCYGRSIPRTGAKTHGQSKTPAWRSYYAMINRCTNKDANNYASYGGRGIKVCDRWMQGFEFFYADMGNRPKGKTIDRIDVNGNYSDENCRWASEEEQVNNKQSTRYLTFKGRKQSVAQWAKECGIPRDSIIVRIELGWNIKDALTVPTQVGRNQFGNGLPVTFNGITMTWTEWSKKLNIAYATLKKRIENGWTLERVLTQPLEKHKSK